MTVTIRPRSQSDYKQPIKKKILMPIEPETLQVLLTEKKTASLCCHFSSWSAPSLKELT